VGNQRTADRSRPPSRSRAARTALSRSRRWAAGARWSQSQPPHVPASGQPGAMRSGAGRTTSRSVPRCTLPSTVGTTRTVSPGRAPGTKSARPFQVATPSPSAERRSTSTSCGEPPGSFPARAVASVPGRPRARGGGTGLREPRRILGPAPLLTARLRGGRVARSARLAALDRTREAARIGKLAPQLLHEAGDAVPELVGDIDELDPHSRNLVGGVVELLNPGHAPAHLEGNGCVRELEDDPHRGPE